MKVVIGLLLFDQVECLQPSHVVIDLLPSPYNTKCSWRVLHSLSLLYSIHLSLAITIPSIKPRLDDTDERLSEDDTPRKPGCRADIGEIITDHHRVSNLPVLFFKRAQSQITVER